MMEILVVPGNLPGLATHQSVDEGNRLWSKVEVNFMRRLHNSNKDRITPQEAAAMEESGAWPDRLVVIYSPMGLEVEYDKSRNWIWETKKP